MARVLDLPPPPVDAQRPRILALAFDSPLRAQEALLAALLLQEREQLVLHDAVVVSRPHEGIAHVTGTSDPFPVAAAVPSALFGALLGSIVAGPVGFLIGGVLAGSAGAVAGKLMDTGIPGAVIAQLRELIAPGETVLALLVGDLDEEAVVAELRRFQGAHVVYAELPAPALERVRQALAA